MIRKILRRLSYRWWMFSLMRHAKRSSLREPLIRFFQQQLGTVPISGDSQLSFPPLGEMVSSLEEDGCVCIRELWSEEQVEQILEFSKSLRCFDPFRPQLGTFSSSDIPQETHVANYRREELAQCQAIMELANDPMILRTVQAFLGARPTISNINMWWSMAHHERAEDAQIFHRDSDDLRFVKLFLYLTDVELEDGPHVYVRGSSKSPKLQKIRRYEDEEIADAFGEENIAYFCEQRGTGFLVDTYGFHKGLLPQRKPRLILQIQYSLFPILIERYQPVVPVYDAAHFDSYINRLLLRA